MKKIFYSLGFLFSLLFLAACGDKTITITVPNFSNSSAGFTQSACDQIAAEKGFDSVTYDEESNSFTYVMKESQHKEIMAELKNQLDASIQEMVTSGDYPNFVSITPNSDYTEIKVVTRETDLNMMESLANINFLMSGAIYNAYNGTKADNICIQYIHEQSGKVIREINSKDIAESKNASPEDSTAQ